MTASLENRIGGFVPVFRTVFLVLFSACLAVVIYLSISPAPPITDIGNDKIGHLTAYCVLMGLWALAWGDFRKGIYGLMGLILLGMGLEFIQAFVPGRSFSLFDIMANIAGITLSVIIVRAATHVPVLRIFVIQNT